MSAQAIADLIALIAWQAPSLYTTARGKRKPVITGIPGKVFWHRWHKQSSVFRPDVRSAGITLKRKAKGQWEAILWPRASNAGLVGALGVTLPEVPKEENPF